MGTPILGTHSAIRSLGSIRSSSPGGHSAIYSPGGFSTPQRATSAASRDGLWLSSAEVDGEGGGEGMSNEMGDVRGLVFPSPLGRLKIPVPPFVDSMEHDAGSGGRMGHEHGLGEAKYPSPPRMAPPSYVPISNLRLDSGWSELKRASKLNPKGHVRLRRGSKEKDGGRPAAQPSPISPYTENLVKKMVVSLSSPRGGRGPPSSPRGSGGPPSSPRGSGGMSRGREGSLRRRRSSTVVPYPGKGEGEGKEGGRGEGGGEGEVSGGSKGRAGEEMLDMEGNKNDLGVNVGKEGLAIVGGCGAGDPAVKEVVSDEEEDKDGEAGDNGGGEERGQEGVLEEVGAGDKEQGASHATSVATEMDRIEKGKGHAAGSLAMEEGAKTGKSVADAGAAELGDGQFVDESIDFGGAQPVQETVTVGTLLRESSAIVEGAQDDAPIFEGAQETCPILSGGCASRRTRISGSGAARPAAVGKRLLGRLPSLGGKVGARGDCLAGDSCFYRGDLVSADKEYSKQLEERADDADLLLKLASLKERQGLPEMGIFSHNSPHFSIPYENPHHHHQPRSRHSAIGLIQKPRPEFHFWKTAPLFMA